MLKNEFKVENLPDDIGYEMFDQIKHFLPPNVASELSWIEKRTSCRNQGQTFTKTDRKISQEDSEKIEIRRQIKARQYEDLLKLVD